VIALSQTDTVEQAGWMHALDARAEGVDRRSSRTKPPASIASYVIALSQTDTVEQARWMHALDTRTPDLDRRSRSDFRLLIDGKLVEGADTLDVINPATARVLAAAPRADRAQLEEAVAAAKAAFLLGRRPRSGSGVPCCCSSPGHSRQPGATSLAC
jgi:hypothetical protein